MNQAEEAAALERLDYEVTENLIVARKDHGVPRPESRAQTSEHLEEGRLRPPAAEVTARKRLAKEQTPGAPPPPPPPRHEFAADAAMLGYDPEFLAALPRGIALEIIDEEKKRRERQLGETARNMSRSEHVAPSPAAEPAAPRDSPSSAPDCAPTYRNPRTPRLLIQKYNTPAPPAGGNARLLEVLESALVMSSVGPPPLHSPSKPPGGFQLRQSRPKLNDAVLRLSQQSELHASDWRRMHQVALSRTAAD